MPMRYQGKITKSTKTLKTANQWRKLGRVVKDTAKPLDGYQSGHKTRKCTRYRLADTRAMTKAEAFQEYEKAKAKREARANLSRT